MVASAEGIIFPVLVHGFFDILILDGGAMDKRELMNNLPHESLTGWCDVFLGSMTQDMIKFFGSIHAPGLVLHLLMVETDEIFLKD